MHFAFHVGRGRPDALMLIVIGGNQRSPNVLIDFGFRVPKNACLERVFRGHTRIISLF